MTLEQARELYRTKGGAIKALAMRMDSFVGIVAELGLKGLPWCSGCTLFGVPIVLVSPDQPEGVIV